MFHSLIGRTGQLLIITLSSIPILLWWPFASFSSPSAVWLSLGQLTALVGYSLYCLNFILSARLKFLEPLFSGLNRIYVFHHLVGATAFIFLLFHPLTIAVSYLNISLAAAVNLLIPTTTNLPIYFGILALSLTIILLIITLYVKLEYDTWKITHKFLGLALFLASIHVFFIGSTLSLSPPLKYYLLGLTVTALASYSYRTLFPKLFVKFLPYSVASTKKLTPDILEIVLKPKNNRTLSFSPGQFIFLRPQAPGIPPQFHPFSLTNPIGSLHISIATKIVGDFTTTLPLLSSGAPVLIEGPFGYFSYVSYPFPRQVWIAGGIGITPFVSLARSLSAYPSLAQIDLYYTVTHPDEAVYTAQFTAITASDPRFRFHLHDSGTQGHLTADSLAHDLPDLISLEVFICGPSLMMTALRTQLRALGLKNSHIHTEEFSLT